MRRALGTVSKALEKSIAMMVVRRGGRCSLKPLAMVRLRGKSAEVVEWRSLKQC